MTPNATIKGGKQPRFASAEEAAAAVKSGDWVDYGAAMMQPDAFDKALAARKDALEGVKIRNCISGRPREVFEVDPEARHFQSYSWHYSGYDRRIGDAGQATYVPVNLGEIADYYRTYLDPIDVAALKVAPKDKDGFYNFSCSHLWSRSIVDSARIVVVEVNDSLPYCHGVGAGVHESDVDFIIEGDGSPPVELPAPAPTEVDKAVGELIAAQIEDGACVQIGIGGMPNAVCASLLASGAKDLGIHTEMLTDGMADLVISGQATGAKKQIDAGRHVFSFALGTQKLYDLLDDNAAFCMRESEYTNLPHVAMRNDNLISINNTTQIDLMGQAASESDGFRQLTGTGGQLQFVRAAYASKGGKSFMCLSSVYEKGAVRRSRIVPHLTPGNNVTTTRMDMHYVVTEFGMVCLKGKSLAERAKALISIAHPDFREELEREARNCGLMPKWFS